MANTHSWDTNHSNLYVAINKKVLSLDIILLFLHFSVLVHDETTFRRGEVSAKWWLYIDQAPFYSKGRGKSNMISDFLVMHPLGPFFHRFLLDSEQCISNAKFIFYKLFYKSFFKIYNRNSSPSEIKTKSSLWMIYHIILR